MNEFLEHSTDNAIDQEPDVSIYLQSSIDKLTKQKSLLEAPNHEQSVSIMDLKYVPVLNWCNPLVSFLETFVPRTLIDEKQTI